MFMEKNPKLAKTAGFVYNYINPYFTSKKWKNEILEKYGHEKALILPEVS